MKTTITIICENSVRTSLPVIGEHGLAMLIEKEDTTLYDTGQGLGIINNLQVLNKNIGAIQRIVLSHGHYDHTGGLFDVLQYTFAKTPVFVNQSAFNDKCAIRMTPGRTIEEPIGMKKTRAEYENAGASFQIISGYVRITDSIFAISDIKRPDGWKSWDARLKQKVDNTICDDPFDDDLSLLVETDSGPVVLLGCAHAGIVEILDELSERSGHREFHAVIGGTHLASAPDAYVAKAIETLRKYRVNIVAVSHCTGFARACQFANEFKDNFASASAGAVFNF